MVLRRNLLAGLAVMLPIAAALWVLLTIISFVDELFPGAWRPELGGRPMPGLGLLLAVLLLWTVGAITRNFFGQRLVKVVESALAHIPVFGRTYGLFKQVVEVIFGKQGEAFRRVVLVEFPRRGIWSIGFVAAMHAEVERRIGMEVVAVFVPTTPNPTGGYYLFVPEQETRPLDMAVDQALKLVVTMGAAHAESGVYRLPDQANRKPR